MVQSLGDEQTARFKSLICDLRLVVEKFDKFSIGSGNRGQHSLVEKARAEYQRRRRREAIFPMAIFGEPAWDLLLDLYISEESGKEISVTSACIASSVPNSTAIRWINLMAELDLVYREKSNNDGRTVFIHLTSSARMFIEQYLEL